MRLICPKCSAQYEVDDSVIPEAGRDVQCSACGNTWFQLSQTLLDTAAEAEREAAESPLEWDVPPPMPADYMPNFDTDDEAEAPAKAPPDAPPTAEDGGVTQAIAAMLADEPIAKPVLEPAPDEDEAPAPTLGATPRRPLDDSLLSILREEAEREAAARRAEGGTIETQEEMNLEPDLAAAAASRAAAKLASATRPAPAAPQAFDFSDLNDDAEERVADLTGTADPDPKANTPRRAALPDIEEINSSLRASADRAGEAAAYNTPQHRAQQRSGFRRGFFSVIGVAVLLAALYQTAPRLSANFPALTTPLARYVSAVNEGRSWLDGQLRAGIERFTPAQ